MRGLRLIVVALSLATILVVVSIHWIYPPPKYTAVSPPPGGWKTEASMRPEERARMQADAMEALCKSQLHRNDPVIE